ncbi:hypothetical protein L1987_09539 [Smallanthus sonchifolius]|uniref:Uncharacterized protein n=1 Tax=Smallanthus sonchifolius TaxID=185202 RepID=A0ACB9JP38_9ASTR|nr:hypothetical protein L1987_09539 [Smallanthus sonchifolius]
MEFPRLLTDYIGRVETVKTVIIRKGKKLRKNPATRINKRHHNSNRPPRQPKKFTCQAFIIDIQENRSWYYTTCPGCNKTAYPQLEDFVCEDNGILLEPKFMFCLNTTIKDETATTTALTPA